MTTNNNLDALSQDAELPFGHPGRQSDDTPEGFEPSPLVDQGPERDYTPDEGGKMGVAMLRRGYDHPKVTPKTPTPLGKNGAKTAPFPVSRGMGRPGGKSPKNGRRFTPCRARDDPGLQRCRDEG